jgi:hypothetical protein
MSISIVGPQPSLPVGSENEADRALYADGRTKQSFKDETDINKVLRKAQRAGTLSHLQKHGAFYGDFSDVDGLLVAHENIKRGQAIYDELPSEVRREFGDMYEFFAYVNDPANAGELEDKLPDLARPGRQNPAVRRSAATEADPAVASAEPPVETPAASGDPSGDPPVPTT